MGSKEGGSPVGTARHPVRAGTGQAGPLLSPLPLRLQEAGDGEGWQAARVARSAAMAAWFVRVGVQGRRRAGNGMGRRNTGRVSTSIPCGLLALLYCSLGS